MPRLAAFAVALFALAAVIVASPRRRTPTTVPRDDAFHFPTTDSHESISQTPDGISEWSERLGCSYAELVDALGIVGNSEHAVRAYLTRPAA